MVERWSKKRVCLGRTSKECCYRVMTRVGIELPRRQERQGLHERMGNNVFTIC